MMRDNGANQPRQRGRTPLTLAAVAVTAAAAGIAGMLIFLKVPGTGSASSGSPSGVSASSAPSSGTQGGSGGGLPALPPLSGNGGGLRYLLNGKVLAISSTSITLGGNGPNVVAEITSSTQVTGNVSSPSGIKVGDQVAAQVGGKDSSDLVAESIQDPA